jgi:hypothetical protein
VKLVLGRWPGQFDRCFSTPAPCKQRLASPAKWTGSLWVPHCRRRPAVTAAAPKHLAISPCNSYRYKCSIIYLMRIVDIANRVKCRFGLDLSRTCWIRVCLVSFTGELHSVPVRRPNLRALECELMERIKRDRPAGVDRVPVSKPHPEGCEVSSAQAPLPWTAPSGRRATTAPAPCARRHAGIDECRCSILQRTLISSPPHAEQGLCF